MFRHELTWVIVWNSPPARLCSCGSATLAMKSVPAANTKSAPTTAMIAAGKPKAQYTALGRITANRRHAADEHNVPVTSRNLIQLE